MLTQNITVISVVTHSHKNIMVMVTVHSTRIEGGTTGPHDE